jgi:hypothetical protein
MVVGVGKCREVSICGCQASLVWRASARHRSLVSEKMLLSLDKTRPLRYITPMPPPTPLPVLTALIGLFRQGFWRRLAGRLFRSKATQEAEEAVEDFLLPILEAIAKIAAAVQAGTYREPEYAPWEPDERDPRPPDEAPKTSGRKPPQIREPEPEPPWLLEPLEARPRAPRPPPAQDPAERPSATSQAPSPPARPRPSWPPAGPAARRPLPPPRVRIPPKKARPKPVKKHAHFVPI